MSGSDCKRRRGRVIGPLVWAAALAVVVSVMSVTGAGRPWAQTGAPLQLVPQPPGAAGPGAPAPDLPRPAPEGIEIDRLDALDASGAGVLTAGDGGFGAGLWDGLDRRGLVDALSVLPPRPDSAAIRRLLRRVLVSAAPVIGPARPNDPDPLTVRMRWLARYGLVADLAAFGRQIGVIAENEPAVDALFDGLLLMGRADLACGEFRPFAERYSGPVWIARRLICALEDGQAATAELNLALLRERAGNGPNADRFLALAEAAVAGFDPAEPRFDASVPTPETLVLMDRVGLGPDRRWLADAGPAQAFALAANRHQDPGQRLAFAEVAARLGTLSPEALLDAYQTADLAAAEPGTEERAPAVRAARLRAALLQSAAEAAAPERRIGAVRTALAASAQEQVPAVLAVQRAVLGPLAAGPETATITAEGAHILFAAGVPDAAAWYQAAQGFAASAADRIALARLWMQAALAGAAAERAADRAEALEVWIDAELAERGDLGQWAAAIALPAFDRLITPVHPDAWHRLPLDDGRDVVPMPSATVLPRLAAAARQGQVGATAIASAVALGSAPLRVAQPVVLAQGIDALALVGLAGAAGELAREALWYAQS